jgi:putative tryptophan/tyrosine transport system substrate-binding protein
MFLTITAGPDIYGKQLQLLKDAFPGTSRVAILLNPSTATYAHTLREIETAIHALRLERQVISVADPSDFNGAFASLAAAHVDAMLIPLDSMFYQHRARLADLALKSRLPAMWGLREHAEAGGLMAYSTDLGDLARRAATFVDKILKGAKPADLPVEQPTTFEQVINLKTAKTLGLTVPPPLLQRADQAIE